MTAAVVATKPLPWWRRLFRRQPKPAKAFAAGERGGSMKAGAQSGLRSILKVRSVIQIGLGLIVAIGIFGYIGVPSVHKYVDEAVGGGIPGVIDSVRKIVAPKYLVVRPASVVASAEVKGHEGGIAFDTSTATDWEATGDSPTLTVTFKNPIDLGAVIVHNGSASSFVDLRRPASLLLTFSDGSSTTLTLQDVHEPQTFNLSASQVESVQIKVLDTNGPASAPIALSELEFFTKD